MPRGIRAKSTGEAVPGQWPRRRGGLRGALALFFGLEDTLGALADAKLLPADSVGAPPDAPDPTTAAPAGTQNGSNAFRLTERSSDGAT